MRVQVLGPDSADVSAADLGRLFRNRPLTPARRRRLSGSARLIAVSGSQVVGLAAYERTGDDVRVHEIGLDEVSPSGADQIAGALIEALEMACLAGGGRRLVLLPRAALAVSSLLTRGFDSASQGGGQGWYTKTFPA